MIFEKQHRQKIAEDDPKNANKLDGECCGAGCGAPVL